MGDKSKAEDMKVIPIWVAMLFTGAPERRSAGEVYWILTAGTKEPAIKREALVYLDRGAWYDITKAKERLGWKPLVTIDEGIRKSVN